jgi:hypothetical protein
MAKVKLHLATDGVIESVYEAGRDGFWIHRQLESWGIRSRVVDSASIEVNRKQRRLKTDRVDLEALLKLLIRQVGGEPKALALIGQLYRIEQEIRDRQLDRAQTQDYRATQAKPVADTFFAWCWEQRQRTDLVNSNPLAKALGYVENHREQLQVYLSNPDVPIDTNHLERGLRPIPMGRKNWLFNWTELGAKQLAAIQSLLVTCRLQGVNPYDYLVDVIQRVSEHPAKDVVELTPRVWKTQFAQAAMKSDLCKAGIDALV